MAKKQQPAWQFRFSFGLSIVMFFLVIAYFVQSFQHMMEIKPVSVAIERISESQTNTLSDPGQVSAKKDPKATADTD